MRLFFFDGLAFGLSLGDSLLLCFVACTVVFDILGDYAVVRGKD